MTDKHNKKLYKLIAVILMLLLLVTLTTGCAKKYTLTFDSDGGSEVAEIKVKEDELAEEPEKPVKEGYEFDGWYTGSVKFNFSDAVTQDVELKAKWLKLHTVIFDAGNETEPITVKVAEGKTVNEIISPTKENSKFVCWYFDTSPYDFKTPVNHDITLTAQWKSFIQPTAIKATKPTITLKKGQTATIAIEFTPKETTEKGLTYQSNKTSVATVTAGGIVTAVKSGTATILVTSSTDVSATVTVKVINPLTDLVISATDRIYVYTGGGHTGIINFAVTKALPTDRDPYKVVWTATNSGSNGAVVIDKDTGMVTANDYKSAALTSGHLAESVICAVAYDEEDKEILKSNPITVYAEPKVHLSADGISGGSLSVTSDATTTKDIIINSNCVIANWGFTSATGITTVEGDTYIKLTLPANSSGTASLNVNTMAGQTMSLSINVSAPPVTDPPEPPGQS